MASGFDPTGVDAILRRPLGGVCVVFRVGYANELFPTIHERTRGRRILLRRL